MKFRLLAGLFVYLFLIPLGHAQSIKAWVDITISPTGKPESIDLIQPKLPVKMANPIIDTIRKWKFESGKIEGKPVTRTTSLAIEISLSKSDDGSSQIIAKKIAEGPRILQKADTTCLTTAKRKGQTGSVSMKYEVNESGKVKDIEIKNSTANSELETCILNITNATIFKPDTLNGNSVLSSIEREFVIK